MKKSSYCQQNQKTLYDQDFLLWLETTANLLKNRQLDQIDYDNLIEEIETMGKSEKTALESNLRVLLMHLLKWKYQPENRYGHLTVDDESSTRVLSNSWRSTIREHRKRIQKAFKDSPSLRPYFDEVFDIAYQDGRELASDETGIVIEEISEKNIFTTEQVLDSEYLPESSDELLSDASPNP